MKELNKEQSNRVLIVILICMFITVLLLPIRAEADMGPKEYIHIAFENMGDELCYGTLLSASANVSYFQRVWDGEMVHNYKEGTMDYEIWKTFVDYQDPDGYYFLQEFCLTSETKDIDWIGGAPDSFKILLYYPEKDVFVSSGIYERYAFSSYYTVDMAGIDISAGTDMQNVLIAVNSYDYLSEIIALIFRVIVTILVELGVAWLFKFRGKKIVGCIVIANIITQGILNVGINYEIYKHGGFLIIITYFLYEWLIFAIEAVIYSVLFPRLSDKKVRVWKCILYAFVANIVTFIGIAIILYWFGWFD